jgi:hypothetical protein
MTRGSNVFFVLPPRGPGERKAAGLRPAHLSSLVPAWRYFKVTSRASVELRTGANSWRFLAASAVAARLP